jgi:Protein of unknown function (DUF1616)
MSLALPRLKQKGMARRPRRLWFFTLYVVGCASVATSTGYTGYSPAVLMRVPQAAQIVLGLLMVFVVPGLSLVCAALPEPQSWVEGLLASVGISVSLATGAAVLLAATPIGFSRQPLGESLGGIAVVLSLGGIYRSRLAATVWELRAWMNAWIKKHSIGEQGRAQRPNNSAKLQRDTDTDVQRSLVVLKFSFDGKPDQPRV